MANRTKFIINGFLAVLFVCCVLAFWSYSVNFKPSVDWRTTIEAQLQWRNMVLLILFAAITGLVALFFCKPALRLNACLMFFSTYFSLFIINAGFGLYKDKKYALTIKRSGVDYDHRDIFQVLFDMRKQGEVVYPFVTPQEIFTNYLEDANPNKPLLPFGGISHVKTVMCNEMGFFANYLSDRYGFNNDDSVYDDTSLSPILLLGDSFTLGACVEQSQNVAGRLRENGYRSISLGISGIGPLAELAILKEYGHKIKPSIVLWLYYNQNDLRDIMDEFRVPALKKYLKKITPKTFFPGKMKSMFFGKP